ncbi:MAG: c-type cytochrome [Halieaceae bacterium]|jgi:cytochrome c oxidase cbb3-type subunit III|nr:c-type cytochrome [Halieaceae bacterium]
MHTKRLSILLPFLTILVTAAVSAAPQHSSNQLQPIRTLTANQTEVAAENYKKYCALCHGKNRQGYANDHAPSLRSRSLFESGIPHAVLRPLSYGRQGTAMGGYLDEVGGPMSLSETWDLTYWLFEQSGAERVYLSTNPVSGDIARGQQVYEKECATCHGEKGEGVTAPALANQSALAHNTDEFIRHAIVNGRNDTQMNAFAGKLSADDIDNVTAFLRSRASGWKMEKPVLRQLPTADQYIINPQGADPDFKLTNNLYVSSKDLFAALNAQQRMVLLDTRVTSVWQRAHIQGSFPLPYYADFDAIVAELPKDVQIIAYCSCPRAAADSVIAVLRRRGYSRTAVLYEGIFGWMNLGYPVMRSDLVENTD